MRKTKKTETSISLGWIALKTLYHEAWEGNLTAAIYILDHPNIERIDVYKMMRRYQQGANRLKKKFTEIKNKKGRK